jgi:hypothetical protein
MSTPPGQYADLAALDSASVAAPAPADQAPAAFVSQTQMPLITWGTQGEPSVAMPGIYVTQSDQLQVGIVNSNAAVQTMTAYVRILQPNGTILTESVVVPNVSSARIAQSAPLQLSEGMLVGLVLDVGGVQTFRGQTFVNAYLFRNVGAPGQLAQTLIADYLTYGYKPYWPGSAVHSGVDGQGLITTYVSAVPTGSNAPTITQPAGTRWRVISAQASLAAGNSVSNRIIALEILNGAQLIAAFSAASLVTANQNATISFGSGMALTPSLGQPQGIQSASMPNDFFVANQSTLSILEFSGGASDVWTAMAVQVEEWIDV